MINDSLQNGSGNGVIVSEEDAKRFWRHLIAADALNLELVNGYPLSKVGGHYTISSNIPGKPGTWIVLCGGATNHENFTGILSPEEAYLIDKDADDGNPLTGEIQAIKSSTAKEECFIDSRYNFKNKNKDCALLFKIW
jgi:hypothetical protein